MVHQLIQGDFPLDPPRFKFLFNNNGDRLLGEPAVDRKRVAVLVIAQRRIGGVHLYVLPDGFHPVFFVLQCVLDAPLIGSQEPGDRCLFLVQPGFLGGKGFIGPFREDFFQIQKFDKPLRLGNLGHGEPDDAGIHPFGCESGKAGRRAADLHDRHLFGIDAKMVQRCPREKVRKRPKAADREALPFRLFHGVETGLRVKLKRHEIADPPKVLDVEARSPPPYGLHKGASHNLDVAADQSLEIRRAGVEHDKEHIQPLVLKKTFLLRHIDRQKGDVHRGETDDDLGLGRRRTDKNAQQEKKA